MPAVRVTGRVWKTGALLGMGAGPGFTMRVMVAVCENPPASPTRKVNRSTPLKPESGIYTKAGAEPDKRPFAGPVIRA